MPKIVAVDTDFEDNNLEEAMARDAGIEFEVTHGRTAQAVIDGLLETGADAVVTSYAMFPHEVFEACPNLKAVSRTGVGYDEIDVEAATEYGVAVCNVPGYGTEVVSDHAITLALSVLRRINELDADMRRGVWDYARTRPLGQCRGRVFGVVGMGEIGRAAAKKAAGMGFEVVCWSRSLKPGRRTPEGYPVLRLEELLQTADVVSLHVPATTETRQLISAEMIARMKPTALLINTARGPVVDNAALVQALNEGTLAGAGIDVFDQEPPLPAGEPLLGARNAVLTPHVAFATDESMLRRAEIVFRNLQAYLDGKPENVCSL